MRKPLRVAGFENITAFLVNAMGRGCLVSAAAAGLFWFMNSPSFGALETPIAFTASFMVTLIGWFLILQKLLADVNADSPRQHTLNDRQESVQCEMQNLIACLAGEFRKQFHYANRELMQSQDLLADAINTLTTSFTSIHDQVNSQRTLALTGTAGNRQDSVLPASAGNPADALPVADDLDKEITTAIRALQFQDLTTQLLDHALHRIAAMDQALSELPSISVVNPSDSAELIVTIEQAKATIMNDLANLDEHKTNPVSQGHMGTGDIELF